MKSSVDRVLASVIFISAVALLGLGVLAFYLAPQYEKGVWAAIEAFKDVLLVSVGVKGGLSVPDRHAVDSPPKDPAVTE